MTRGHKSKRRVRCTKKNIENQRKDRVDAVSVAIDQFRSFVLFE